MGGVKRQAGKLDGGAAGGDEDFRGGDGARAGGVFHFDSRGVEKPASPANGFDLITPEEQAHPIGECFDDFVFAGKHDREVEIKLANLDAMVGQRVFGGVVFFSRVQKCFARDAANVETDAAKILLLNARNAQAQLCGTNGGHIPARAGADDDQIEGSGFRHG